MKFLISVLAALLFSMSYGSISGRVVDNLGNPVPWAMVTFEDVAYRMSWAYTDDQGAFCISNAEEFPNSICSGALSISGNPAPVTNPLFFSGTNLNFQVENLSGFQLSIRGVDGRELFSHSLGQLSPGAYQLPLLQSSSSSGSNLCFAVLKANGRQSIAKIFIDPSRLVKGGARYLGPVSKGSLQKPASANTAFDIRIGKTGYTSVVKTVATGMEAVGDIVLAAFDVEAKVTEIMNLLSESAIKGQIQQGDGFKRGQDVVSRKMGTALVAGDSWPGQNDKAPLSEWRAALTKLYGDISAATEQNLPPLISADLVHGVNMVSNVTIVPHEVGLGATFDTNLVEKVYRLVSFEAAGLGFNWSLGPTVAVPRHLYWGRTYEGFGETPELTRWMSKASVVGIQGTDLSHPWTIAACAKHFMGDGGTKDGFDRGHTTGPLAELMRIHWPGYEEAIKWDVASIMTSFSTWAPDGATPTAMKFMSSLQKDLLRTQGGFKGFMQGDYVDHDGVYPQAVAAGFGVALVDPNSDGAISGHASVIDNSWGSLQNDYRRIAQDIIRVKVKMGLTGQNRTNATQPLFAHVGSAAHRAVAREAVRKSMVLLKNNNGALPLQASESIHLAGKHSNSISLQCGGWTITWQGLIHRPEDFSIGGTTIRQGFQAKAAAGGGQISTGYNDDLGSIGAADKVVVVVGEWPTAEWYGDVNTNRSHLDNLQNYHTDKSWNFGPPLKLYDGSNNTPNQKKLVADAKATGKPVVCVLMVGRPIDISEQLDQCDAIAVAWLPGTEGDGIAEVLYGDYEFTGMLPHSWPTTKTQEPINFGDGQTPLFPYGWGLKTDGTEMWSTDVTR